MNINPTASKAAKTDKSVRVVSGIRVALCKGELHVDHFGRSPHVAVYYRPVEGEYVQTGWLPLCLWEGGKIEPEGVEV